MLWLVTLSLFAQPVDLISTQAGVYFRARTGMETYTGYLLRPDGELSPLGSATIVDISDDGRAATASSAYYPRRCGFGGSTCFLAAPCAAVGGLTTAAGTQGFPNRKTSVRLDGAGGLAWISQFGECRGLGGTPAALLNGLYDPATLKLIAAGPGGGPARDLASPLPGRRMISKRGEVLLADATTGALSIFSARGGEVPLGAAAGEAVFDAEACQVAYATKGTRELHWHGCETKRHEDLGVAGSELVITANGRFLAFLDADRKLVSYDRAVRGFTTGLIDEPIAAMTVDGETLICSLQQSGAIVRMSLLDGSLTTLFEGMPQIFQVHAMPRDLNPCPFICYAPQEPVWLVFPGLVLGLDGAGFHERLPGLQVISNKEARLTVAAEDVASGKMRIGPLTLLVAARAPYLNCLQITALGDANYRLLYSNDGSPLPAFADPTRVEALAAPYDLEGIRALDFRLLRPVSEAQPLFAGNATAGCVLMPQ